MTSRENDLLFRSVSMYGEVTSGNQQALHLLLQLIQVASLSIIFYFFQLLVVCLIFLHDS